MNVLLFKLYCLFACFLSVAIQGQPQGKEGQREQVEEDVDFGTTDDGFLYGITKQSGNLLWLKQDPWGPLVSVVENLQPSRHSSHHDGLFSPTSDGPPLQGEEERVSSSHPPISSHPSHAFIPSVGPDGRIYYSTASAKPSTISPTGEKRIFPVKEIVNQHSTFSAGPYFFTSHKATRIWKVDPRTGEILATFDNAQTLPSARPSSRYSTSAGAIQQYSPSSAADNADDVPIYISRTQYTLLAWDTTQNDLLRFNITFGEYFIANFTTIPQAGMDSNSIIPFLFQSIDQSDKVKANRAKGQLISMAGGVGDPTQSWSLRQIVNPNNPYDLSVPESNAVGMPRPRASFDPNCLPRFPNFPQCLFDPTYIPRPTISPLVAPRTWMRFFTNAIILYLLPIIMAFSVVKLSHRLQEESVSKLPGGVRLWAIIQRIRHMSLSASKILVTSEEQSTKISAITSPVVQMHEIGVDAASPSLDPMIIDKPSTLNISERVLGYGSHGTVVFKGHWEGRPVAVKRLLLDFFNVAKHEVELLKQSDDHPNVIRYFYQEQKSSFMYVALELCLSSLYDLVESGALERGVFESDLTDSTIVVKLDTRSIMSQVMAGVQHLHALNICHRDLKPQNILLSLPTGKQGPRILISDFGLSKKLADDQSSFHNTGLTQGGTLGWRAPELMQVINAPNTGSFDPSLPRITKAIDIFSAGCIFFYVFTRGSHPFGFNVSREINIIRGFNSLEDLKNFGHKGFLARDIIRLMISRNPKKRPEASHVLAHPFFWSADKSLLFLLDVTDLLDHINRPTNLEKNRHLVFGQDWMARLDEKLAKDLSSFRAYRTNSLHELLRAIRNKRHHYNELPFSLKQILGSSPEEFLSYFSTRFPMLLIHVYNSISDIENRSVLQSYFTPLPSSGVSSSSSSS